MTPFAARVVAWQRAHGRRDLPWQASRDAYRIWLSEVMLQQTQVATVLPYYPRFIDAFPTVDALAAAPIARVLECWSGLGYYRRAHHLHAAACSVVERHHGRFPTDAATLATLPGIGRSTAAAIAAFASGERGAILDGNVKRVLARHRGIEGWPGAPRVSGLFWRSAEALLPATSDCERDRQAIADYTQGMMDLGATICTRAKPRCDACPVADDCVARLEGRVGVLPSTRPRKALPKREVVVLLLERDGTLLLEERPPTGIWSGLRSFPEAPLGIDVRSHVLARFGVGVASESWLPTLTHAFTHFALTMHPVRVRVEPAQPSVNMPGVEWFDVDSALAAALPSPIRRLIRSLDAKAARAG